MVGLPNIQAYIYIYHLGLYFVLPVVPDTLQDSLPISFNTEPVLARSAPQATFSSAGPRSIMVSLRLHRHLFCMENEDVLTSAGKVSMMDPQTATLMDVPAKDAMDIFIDALTTLSLPKYTDATKAIIPPTLLIRFGNESCIRGFPSAFSKSSSGPWLKNGKMSEVTINFTVTEVEPYSAQYTAANGTLRGISTDLRRGSIWQY